MQCSAEAKLSREEGEALIEMHGLQHPSSSWLSIRTAAKMWMESVRPHALQQCPSSSCT